MATWEDGPEYAPVERPAEFALPPTPPLEVTASQPQQAALAPKERPAFDRPPVAVAPLEQLVPVAGDRRDPARPFDVAASTVTSLDSAWGAAHWSSPGQPAAPGAAPVAPWGPPTGAPWPAPTAPLTVAPPPAVGPFPPPGTPQWFGPGPTPVRPAPPPVVDGRAVLRAATPALVIVLAIGGLLSFLSPIMVAVAFVLSTRVQVAQQQVRRAFVLAAMILGFVALAAFVTSYGFLGDWWSTFGRWSLAASWVLLVTVLALVHRALKRRYVPPSSYPDWG